MLVDDVVNAVAAAWGVVEVVAVAVEPPAPPHGLDHRDDLAALWNEIRALRPNQRAALLLNLRDPESGSAIELFVLLASPPRAIWPRPSE